jgi:hypothetical protein
MKRSGFAVLLASGLVALSGCTNYKARATAYKRLEVQVARSACRVYREELTLADQLKTLPLVPRLRFTVYRPTFCTPRGAFTRAP